jgi:hypothetical protein
MRLRRQEKGRPGASCGGLTIRLPGDFSVAIAAISLSLSAKQNIRVLALDFLGPQQRDEQRAYRKRDPPPCRNRP